MKLFGYQTYFIATDANHVTQHRRIVTPWFYWKLKSIRYKKYKLFEVITVWFDDNENLILKEKLEKLNIVTMVFNKGEK